MGKKKKTQKPVEMSIDHTDLDLAIVSNADKMPIGKVRVKAYTDKYSRVIEAIEVVSENELKPDSE